MSLVLLTAATSCYYLEPLTIEVLQYPQYPLPNKTVRIAFADKSCPPNRDSVGFYYSLDQKIRYSELPADSTLTNSLINGLKSTIYQSDFYDICDDTIEFNQFSYDTKKNFLTVHHPIDADVLVSLEKFSMKDVTSFYPDYYDMIIGNLTVFVSAQIRIYSLHNNSLTAEINFSDTIIWQSYAYNTNDAYNNLPKRYNALPEATFLFGQDFAKDFSPYWIDVERFIYSGRWNPLIQKGADAAIGNNWNRAKYYWDEVGKSKNKSNVATAFFNLAVYEEVNGNFQEAINYVEKALLLKEKNIYQEYLNILKNEQQQVEYLKKLKNK